MERLKVTLYVKGEKRVARVDDRSRWGYSVRIPPKPWETTKPSDFADYKYYREVEYESVLPKDQKQFVEMVKALGEHHGFQVEVIDAAKEGFFKKLMRERIKQIIMFPTLVTSKGEKIEGYASKEEIRKLLGLKSDKRQ